MPLTESLCTHLRYSYNMFSIRLHDLSFLFGWFAVENGTDAPLVAHLFIVPINRDRLLITKDPRNPNKRER